MMTITTLRKLVALKRKADRFTDSLPMSINAAFFDNDLSTSYYAMVDLLIGELCEGYQSDHVEWLLYEWHPTKNIMIVDGVEFNFKTEEEFYDWLVKNEDWQWKI
jgi:hypothetical protein